MSVTIYSFSKSNPVTVPLELAVELPALADRDLNPNTEQHVDMLQSELDYQISTVLHAGERGFTQILPTIYEDTPPEEDISYDFETVLKLYRKLGSVSMWRRCCCCSSDKQERLEAAAEFMTRFKNFILEGNLSSTFFDLSRIAKTIIDHDLEGFKQAAFSLGEEDKEALLQFCIDTLIELSQS